MPEAAPGLFLGQSDKPEHLLFHRANRHGVVAGATGTGKTVTLQIMAQGFSDAGVPVFCADVKGDLSGICVPGSPNEKLLARAAGMGLTLTPRAAPTVFWDLYGLKGHPIRTTVSEIGPLLLARMLNLNEVQEGVLSVVFHVADKEGLLLLDLDDLRAMLAHVGENAERIGREVGNVAPASIASIQRALLQLEQQGGKAFFGEPALRLEDMMRTGLDGRGQVNVLDATKLMASPRLYAAFLLWLLSELFEQLPEVGDPEKPRLVFFFDEAHLLFTDASKDFLAQVVQTVRLIRSKGVGVFFVTQSPRDLPAPVLAQLGNRVQHALRAHTPDDERALRAAVRTFPRSPVDLADLLTTLGIGEAVVTVLDEDGSPTPVAWTRLRAPSASMEPLEPATAQALVVASPLHGRYDAPVDRESAYELLQARARAADALAEKEASDGAAREQAARERAQAEELERLRARAERGAARGRSSRVDDPLGAFLRSAGTVLGREITRTVLGTRRR